MTQSWNPDPPAGDHLSDLLARASHLMTECLHTPAEWRGVRVNEWRVLATLAEQDGVSMTELAARVLSKQPTLTKAIDRMERAGLVERRTPENDRRRTLVFATARGRSLAVPLLSEARQRESAMLAEFGEANVLQLKSALHALIDHLFQSPRPHATKLRPRSRAMGPRV